MMKRLLLPVLALGLGFGLLTTLPSPAAESAAAPEKIAKLINQLGSNEFEDREAAQKRHRQVVDLVWCCEDWSLWRLRRGTRATGIRSR